MANKERGEAFFFFGGGNRAFQNTTSKQGLVENSLDIEPEMGDIRAVDGAFLLDLEVAHKATIRGLLDGDQTVAFANLGRDGGGFIYSCHTLDKNYQ